MSDNESEISTVEETQAAGTRLLGFFAMIAAPALATAQIFIYAGPDERPSNQLFTSLLGVFYLAGIAAAVIAMRRLRVTGNGAGAAILFAVQIVGLVLAMGFDIIEYVAPHLKESTAFFICDMAYPFSHTIFVIVGFAVMKAGVWRGWRVAVPFVCGLSLPAFFLSMAVFGRENSGVVFMGGTVLGFFLLGLAVTTWRRPPALQVPLEFPQPQH